MTFRATYNCNICLRDMGTECLQVRFTGTEAFKVETGGPNVRFHMCLCCSTQMRDELNRLTAEAKAGQGKESAT